MDDTFQYLIEHRKSCIRCEKFGLCGDLTQKDSKGMLYQMETILKGKFETNLLGLWNPANNANPLTASVLIIGQDFSNVGYFDKINVYSELNDIESNNVTNKKLLEYIQLSGVNNEEIFFTNAVLCIKSGKMNAPIKSSWLTNCSDSFLKPLISQHLTNLKTIITLGKVALDAIRVMSDETNTMILNFSEKDSFSSLPGNKFEIHIQDKPLTLYPMFHPGRLGARNASRVKKKPGDLWKSILPL